MSHYHTSCANITIGLLRPTIPELVFDSDSERGTPLVTPIHTNFGNISNTTNDASGIPTRFDRIIFSEFNHQDKRPLLEGWRDCPSAPRIDNGSFESSFGLDMSVDSNFEDNYNSAFNKASTHLQHSLVSGNSKYSPGEVRRPDTGLAYDEQSALEGTYGVCTVPQTPRPHTGSRLLSTGNAAPTWNWNSERRGFRCPSQFHAIIPSASVEPTLSQHAGSNSNSRPAAERLTPDAPTRTLRWNLGLGLTLDDIAEPDGCGASAGELSMEFAEDSFFDLDTDFGYCSTADTTLNTTTETIPDLAMPCPDSPVGSASQTSGPELGITPQLRMLSLQSHHKSVKRQRAQHSPTSASGTRLAHTTRFPSEIDIACLVGRLGMNELGEFRGLSNGGAQEFVAEEYLLIEEAQGRLGHQISDAPIFALLPPIEL